MSKSPYDVTQSRQIIDRMRDAYGVGSDRALAEELGLLPSAVGNWRRRGIPPACVNYIARDRPETCMCWVLQASSPERGIEPSAAFVCWGAERMRIPADDRAVNLVRRWALLSPAAQEQAVGIIEAVFDALGPEG